MKFSHLLLAAALCTASAASAQTSPTEARPANKSAAPSVTPSGMPAKTTSDGPTSAGELSPANTRARDKQAMKDHRAKGEKMKMKDDKMPPKM